jgi:hypothetical protein
LDEYGKARGRAEAWARRAKMGEFVQDTSESLAELSFPLRAYSILSAAGVSFAFGRSTPTLLTDYLHVSSPQILQGALLVPGLVLAAASLGSSVACGFLFAPEKNRNSVVWVIKGLLGGPLALSELRGLETLVTYEEEAAVAAQTASKS